MLSPQEFAKKHLKLLKLEEKEEQREKEILFEMYPLKVLEEKGMCLLKVVVSNRCISERVAGRWITILKKIDGALFSPHNFKAGDTVSIRHYSKCYTSESFQRGVIHKVKDRSISVVLHGALPKDGKTKYNVFHEGSGPTYERMRDALHSLQMSPSRSADLIAVLFGNRKPTSLDGSEMNIDFKNINLNEQQKDAVQFALCQNEIAVIHGPPGTGKTTTIVEIILQMRKQGLKVLACASSNTATDNLVSHLSTYTQHIVRLGHPARVAAACKKYNLDFIIRNSESIKKVNSQLTQLFECLHHPDFSKCTKRCLKVEEQRLRHELIKHQNLLIEEALQNSDIIVSTLLSFKRSAINQIPLNYFDVAIIDECPQALEAACWVALMEVKKCILAGDHMQLYPVVISETASKEGLNDSLMKRVLEIHGDSIKRMLTVQYRMHYDIMHWPSKELYDGKLVAHESVCSHVLKDFPGVCSDDEDMSIPLLFIDTADCDLHEFRVVNDDSIGNEGEAYLVKMYVEKLISSNLPAKDIAVIAPYSLQVEILKSILKENYPTLEIQSVDGFQGREKEAVIISFVRSNSDDNVGFLKEFRRTNVAITRAKRQLIVVGNSKTLSCNLFMKKFLDYLEMKGKVRSASQYKEALQAVEKIDISKIQESMQLKMTKEIKSRFEAGFTKKNQAQESNKTDHQKEDRMSYNFKEKILHFLNGPDDVLKFSSKLNSHQRSLIRKIAKELNIYYSSYKVHGGRCGTLRKRSAESVSR